MLHASYSPTNPNHYDPAFDDAPTPADWQEFGRWLHETENNRYEDEAPELDDSAYYEPEPPEPGTLHRDPLYIAAMDQAALLNLVLDRMRRRLDGEIVDDMEVRYTPTADDWKAIRTPYGDEDGPDIHTAMTITDYAYQCEACGPEEGAL